MSEKTPFEKELEKMGIPDAGKCPKCGGELLGCPRCGEYFCPKCEEL